MRYCTLAALLCLLIPAAAFAQQSRPTFGDVWNRPASPTQRTAGHGHHTLGPVAANFRVSDGPGHHILGPEVALLSLLGPGHHMLGPVAALLGLFGPGHHIVGPTAALCDVPAGRGNRHVS